MNKKANEHMEESDKMPRKMRTRLRIRDGVTASPGSSITSDNRTSSSSSWSNVSPRSPGPQRARIEPVTTEPRASSGAAVGRKPNTKHEPTRRDRDLTNKTAPTVLDEDQGEYYIRRYRRESRTPSGEVQILHVRDYVYWPPERRKSRTGWIAE